MPFASTSSDAPMSARTAIQSVATPATAEVDPDVLGMLAFGEQTLFFSHLPLFSLNPDHTRFMSHHRFQVIVQAEFTPEQMASYVKDRKANPKTQFYTIDPQPFVLSQVFEPKGAPKLTAITATVVNGHFERDPHHEVPGLKDVKIKIARVVHGREFDPRVKKPPTLEYLFFGRGSERFLAHTIFAPADFDHVLAVKSVSADLTDRDLEQDVRIVIPEHKNIAKERLREGQRVDGMLHIGSSAASKVQLELERQIYFEERELRS